MEYHRNRSPNYNSTLPVQGAMRIIYLSYYIKTSVVLLNSISYSLQFQVLILHSSIDITNKLKLLDR